MKFRFVMVIVLVAMLAGTAVAQGPVDPIPYPEGIAMPGGAEAKRFALEEMVQYYHMDEYHEPAWVTELVEAGQLPPVEERLPVEPQVFMASGMSAGIGEYGGVWRDFAGVPTEGWNLCAGQTQGWYGINYAYGESLVKSGPMFLRSDVLEPFPNLAKSWEWSEDGTQLTMEIIEGAKWSDGEPFGVHDIMFTWEHIILDDNVNSWTKRGTWQIGGEDVTLEAGDDNTIVWTFPQPFPVQMLFNMDFLDFNVCAEHVYAPMHPAFNDESDYQIFEQFQVADDLPVATMGPWVPVEYRIDELLVMRRNPYYWKVDEAGNQMPYLDEVTFEKGDSGIGRTLGTLAGSIDHTNLENPSTFVEAGTRAQEDDAHFYIEWGPETLIYNIEVNLSADLGVENDRDAALRELFRDFRFRRALQHAIDGDGLGQAIIRGPFLRAFAGGIAPGSPYFDIDSVVYYPYDPDSSRLLLAELGFEDTDGDGIVNWPADKVDGDNLILSVLSNEADAATVQVAEATVLLLQDVGIQVNHRTLQGPTMTDMVEAGTWEVIVDRVGQEWTTPFTRCQDLAPIQVEAPPWHYASDAEGTRDLLPFEEEMIEIVEAFCIEPDFEVRKEMMSEYNKIFTENIYLIGGVVGRYGLALAERFENIPVGSPPFFYQWTWGNVQPDQVWVAPENQLQQILPGVLPVYED